jgi:hypothetical protein
MVSKIRRDIGTICDLATAGRYSRVRDSVRNGLPTPIFNDIVRLLF